jgi:hypothetical protein
LKLKLQMKFRIKKVYSNKIQASKYKIIKKNCLMKIKISSIIENMIPKISFKLVNLLNYY